MMVVVLLVEAALWALAAILWYVPMKVLTTYGCKFGRRGFDYLLDKMEGYPQ